MEFELHHIGIAVRSIESASSDYERRFGYAPASPIYEDPVQQAMVQFWRLPTAGHYLEFVSPLGEKSHLNNAIEKGRQLNHLCYVVKDIEFACRDLQQKGMFLLRSPVEAVAFSPRRIAWLLGGDGIPMELVESGDYPWTAAS